MDGLTLPLRLRCRTEPLLVDHCLFVSAQRYLHDLDGAPIAVVKGPLPRLGLGLPPLLSRVLDRYVVNFAICRLRPLVQFEVHLRLWPHCIKMLRLDLTQME